LLREKFYPLNINHMHPKGTSFGASAVKFFVRLDLDQICLFLDEHQLAAYEAAGAMKPAVIENKYALNKNIG
jgi:hypothetical protein